MSSSRTTTPSCPCCSPSGERRRGERRRPSTHPGRAATVGAGRDTVRIPPGCWSTECSSPCASRSTVWSISVRIPPSRCGATSTGTCAMPSPPGPPGLRCSAPRQALALEEAGLLRFAGPRMHLDIDEEAGRFAVRGADGSTALCDGVLEAHLPPVDLPAYRSPLLRRLAGARRGPEGFLGLPRQSSTDAHRLHRGGRPLCARRPGRHRLRAAPAGGRAGRAPPSRARRSVRSRAPPPSCCATPRQSPCGSPAPVER